VSPQGGADGDLEDEALSFPARVSSRLLPQSPTRALGLSRSCGAGRLPPGTVKAVESILVEERTAAKKIADTVAAAADLAPQEQNREPITTR
jgi:hypothetical protein